MKVLSLCLLSSLALADRTAGLELAIVGNTVVARVRVAGIPKCPSSGSVYVEWTSPNPAFPDTVFPAKWTTCRDGKATASTYRTIQRNGVRARGPWIVRVLSGGRVLAQGSALVR